MRAKITNSNGQEEVVEASAIVLDDGSVLSGINGAADVAPNGVTVAAKGTLATAIMNPAAGDMDGTEAAIELFDDATGVKAFSIEPLTALTAGQPLLVGYSTTAGDGAAVAAIVNSLNTAEATPDGILNSNGYVITGLEDEPIVIVWDGTTTIKTIAVRLVASGTLVDCKLTAIV